MLMDCWAHAQRHHWRQETPGTKAKEIFVQMANGHSQANSRPRCNEIALKKSLFTYALDEAKQTSHTSSHITCPPSHGYTRGWAEVRLLPRGSALPRAWGNIRYYHKRRFGYLSTLELTVGTLKNYSYKPEEVSITLESHLTGLVLVNEIVLVDAVSRSAPGYRRTILYFWSISGSLRYDRGPPRNKSDLKTFSIPVYNKGAIWPHVEFNSEILLEAW